MDFQNHKILYSWDLKIIDEGSCSGTAASPETHRNDDFYRFDKPEEITLTPTPEMIMKKICF